MTESFTVRFYTNTPSRPKNDFGYSDDATLEVGPDALTIDGRMHRSFRFVKQETMRLPLQDVWNVWSDRDEIIFDYNDKGKQRTVGFTVSSPNDSRRLMELLPTRQSNNYALRQNERDVFYERIQHWGPGSPVMWTLVAVNVAIFALMWLAGTMNDNPYQTATRLVRWGSNFGPLTASGQWWRLVTSTFLHGGLLHILFNMVALVQVGGLVERMFGSTRFLALYLIAGVFGSLASIYWNPHVNSVGASGAIFGIMGGLLAFVRNPDSGVPATIVKELRTSAGGFVVFNIFAGFVYPHTDNAAHIGGLVGGYLAGVLLARSLHLPGSAR